MKFTFANNIFYFVNISFENGIFTKLLMITLSNLKNLTFNVGIFSPTKWYKTMRKVGTPPSNSPGAPHNVGLNEVILSFNTVSHPITYANTNTRRGLYAKGIEVKTLNTS